MRQPHPELNFRRGRGRIKELRYTSSVRAFVEAALAIGMSKDEIIAEVEKMKIEKKAQDVTP